MIHKIKTPSALIFYIGTHGMAFVQYKCLVGTNCCIINDKLIGELYCSRTLKKKEIVLTQSPSGGDLAEGSRPHFILGQDAELILCARGQARHLQAGAVGRGDGHGEPVLPLVIIAR